MVNIFIREDHITERLLRALGEHESIQGAYAVNSRDRRAKILQGNVVALIIPEDY